MVLTGQFSGGKSKLIEALTDGAVVPGSAADITTDKVTEYSWDGAVVLVDTPGVKSGLRTHDDLALVAIGKADFILFVMHSGLFDDPLRDYLRYLANTLRMFGQMIVVITQTGRQGAAEGERGEVVHEALGTVAFNLPVIEVDSVFYLMSLEGGTRAEQLRLRRTHRAAGKRSTECERDEGRSRCRTRSSTSHSTDRLAHRAGEPNRRRCGR